MTIILVGIDIRAGGGRHPGTVDGTSADEGPAGVVDASQIA